MFFCGWAFSRLHHLKDQKTLRVPPRLRQWLKNMWKPGTAVTRFLAGILRPFSHRPQDVKSHVLRFYFRHFYKQQLVFCIFMCKDGAMLVNESFHTEHAKCSRRGIFVWCETKDAHLDVRLNAAYTCV